MIDVIELDPAVVTPKLGFGSDLSPPFESMTL